MPGIESPPSVLLSSTESNALAYPVDPSQLRNAREWTAIERIDWPNMDEAKYGECIDLIRFLGTGFQDHSRLGLHRLGDQIRPSHFTGAVWLEKPNDKRNGIAFIVAHPKIDKLDHIEMFIRVASSPNYARVAGRIFDCNPDDHPIHGDDFAGTTLLQVAVYLKELAEFCQRNLRYGFIQKYENLLAQISELECS